VKTNLPKESRDPTKMKIIIYEDHGFAASASKLKIIFPNSFNVNF
jgi:hypothetical protein